MKRRLVSALLVLAMCASVMTTAFAGEATTGEVDVETKSGGAAEKVEVIVTVAKNDDGSETTVKETAVGGDLTDSELTVNYQSQETVDSEGNVISSESSYDVTDSTGTYTAEGGSEIKTQQVSPGVTVEIPAVAGASNTKESELKNETVPTNPGDALKSENPANYDQTTITVLEQGSVTVESGSFSVTVQSSTTKYEGIGPDAYEGKQGLSGDSYIDFRDPTIPDEEEYQPKGNGYDFWYVGYGEQSDITAPGYMVQYKKNDDGSLATDADGNYIVESTRYLGNVLPTQFRLQGPDGEVYAYCVDLEIDPVNKAWYKVDNLEDSTYFASEESPEHIRAIMENGYWGSSNEANADGSYKDGSLAKVKQDLKASLTAETDVEIVLEDGTVKKLSEVIDGMTEGEAMAATQAAIWAYANGATDSGNGQDRIVIGDPGAVLGGESGARTSALYQYLVGLTSEQNETDVIDGDKFAKDISLVIGDKVAEGSGTDAEGNEIDQDVYEVDLQFSMIVVPDAENDDLIVQLFDNNGTLITSARLAGEETEEKTKLGKISPDENGNYVLTGLQLAENTDIQFDLKLVGMQELEKGVYIYTAEGGTNASQTMVGIGEGTNEVNGTMSMTLSFDVQDATITTERVWREEVTQKDTNVLPEEKDEVKTETDQEEIPEEEVPLDDLTEIEDEEIPLADVPHTGDNAICFVIVAVLSAMGLAVLALTRKREEV